MMRINESHPEIHLTPSMRDTIEFCYQNSRDENSQVVVEIYVEGSQDVEFYTAWIDKSGLDFNLEKLSVVVNEIKDAKNDKELAKPEVASGNCGRIREYARLNEKYIRIIWISDRDLLKDNELKEYSRDNLFFTDFPAIESYGFLPKVLSRVNKSMYESQLNALETCFDFLRDYLRGVYFYRYSLQLVENPPKVKIWRNDVLDKLEEYIKNNGENQSINDFIKFASEIIPEEIAVKMETATDDMLDPRTYAYGHDIAPAIKRFIIFEERSLGAKASKTIKEIESCILKSYIKEEMYTQDPLFVKLGNRIKYVYDELQIKY